MDFFCNRLFNRMAHAQVVYNQIPFGIGVGVDHVGYLHVVLDWHDADVARGGTNP